MWTDFKTTAGGGVVGGAGIRVGGEDVGIEVPAKVEGRREDSLH